MNHDDETRTSLPAMVPILKVPGGLVTEARRSPDGPDWSESGLESGAGPGSGTHRGYPTPGRVGGLAYAARMTTDQSPAERVSTPVDGVEVLGALSPSRAGDFMTCPLLYRYRTIDRLPEPPSTDAVRGTVVHKVLEVLFDLPAAERTPEQARELLVPAWDELLEADPALAEMLLPTRSRGRTSPPG